MLTADLYIRVSTEEQANKGYSQRYQEEVLKYYCETADISINKIIIEDFSAKSFRRPEWAKWFNEIKARKLQKVDLLLFTKWDRFSRNTGDAYYMIGILDKLGIESRAIEQPLDLSIPENKMMLAFYLAAPEVENARRSLNIKQGMRRAKKEGRWISLAPVGYKNKITEAGIKHIARDEPQASLMLEAFKLLADGKYNINQVFLHAAKNGLRCERNAFRSAISNPVYCGRIFLPASGSEESTYIEGSHEPIVSVELFNQVQKIHKKRQARHLGKMATNDRLPFRGYLKCPECGKNLTGSRSRSKSNRYYYYYHCTGKCKTRFRSEMVYESFLKELSRYNPLPEYIIFFKEQLRRILLKDVQLKVYNQKILTDRINELIRKINKAEELMLLGDITGDDYRRIKEDAEAQINILGDKISMSRRYTGNIDRYTKQMAGYLTKLNELFDSVDVSAKGKLIDCLFPSMLIFDTMAFQPTELNKAVRIIYNRNIAFIH